MVRRVLALPLFVLVLLKVVLRKLILGLFIGLQFVFRYKISSALIVLLLAALVLTNLRQPAGGAATAAAAGRKSLPPSVGAEAYLNGLATYDARLVWGAMNDEFRQGMMQQGGPQYLVYELETAKARGERFVQVDYVIGYQMQNGYAIYLYVVTKARGNETGQVPYLFTIDGNGKVANVD